MADVPHLRAIIAAATAELQVAYLDPAQIEASFAFMGLDTQLLQDGTYLLAMAGNQIVACGGWSRRATGYGGDAHPGRDDRLLDPRTEAARIRAMFTRPDFARRGAGRFVLSRCEDAARSAGFRRAELSATLAGEPLYRACGYAEAGRFAEKGVPIVKMEKWL